MFEILRIKIEAGPSKPRTFWKFATSRHLSGCAFSREIASVTGQTRLEGFFKLCPATRHRRAGTGRGCSYSGRLGR